MEKILQEIRQQTEELLKKQDRVLVAIDGSCTAGKSTLSKLLAAELDCSVFHMDDFFLRQSQRTAERLAETGGNVDYERFREEVLLPLKQGKAVAYRPYDCRTRGLTEIVEIQPKRINIIEGTYSQHPYFGQVYDLKVYLKVSPQVREQRIRQRLPHYQKQFLEVWIPMEQKYFAEFAIEEKADLAVCPRDNQ